MADPKEIRTTLFTPGTGCGTSLDYAQGMMNRVDALVANASRANNLTPDRFKGEAVLILSTCSRAIEGAIHSELSDDARPSPTLK